MFRFQMIVCLKKALVKITPKLCGQIIGLCAEIGAKPEILVTRFYE